jgi:hypothetical protein
MQYKKREKVGYKGGEKGLPVGKMREFTYEREIGGRQVDFFHGFSERCVVECGICHVFTASREACL